MTYTYKGGKWSPSEPPNRKIGLFNLIGDIRGRGEFLVTEKDGSKRWTKGWRDWRGHLKRNGLVDITGMSKADMTTNRAPRMAQERMKEAVARAIPQAIEKVRQRPYFDKRVAGLGSRIGRDEALRDLRKFKQQVKRERVHA